MKDFYMKTYKTVLAIGALVSIGSISFAQNYIGNLTANKFLPPAPPSSVNLQNRFGNDTNSPKLYDSNGNFHGNVNSNQYDPNSVSNPYGKYGSKYSQESINNPYGAGSKYRQDSPNNPYGQGMRVYGK